MRMGLTTFYGIFLLHWLFGGVGRAALDRSYQSNVYISKRIYLRGINFPGSSGPGQFPKT